MKTLESARHGIERLRNGQLLATIHHDTMKGVTPQMLRWWFETLDASTRFNGVGPRDEVR